MRLVTGEGLLLRCSHANDFLVICGTDSELGVVGGNAIGVK
jgi:hypothetical protein